MDPCSINNPCVNGATCTNTKIDDKTYEATCNCSDKFAGLHCEIGNVLNLVLAQHLLPYSCSK